MTDKPLMIRLLNLLIHPSHLVRVVRARCLGSDVMQAKDAFRYDYMRFITWAGVFKESRSNLNARIMAACHGVEKGLTMPHPCSESGKNAVSLLADLIRAYKKGYGSLSKQGEYAVGVLKAYREKHAAAGQGDDAAYWQGIDELLAEYPEVPIQHQDHLSKDAFYADREGSFPSFARARHTSRHFCGAVSEDVITEAVRLAMTAPSACNRQPVRVHCVADPALKDKVLDLQSGNRGFGHDGDKVLIVTGDLSTVCWIDERSDLYTNCGIFLMNLSYALYYHQVAHCILNWSIAVDPDRDKELHELVGIPDNEVVSALVVCGGTPDELDVARSPRREVNEVLVMHRAKEGGEPR